MKFSPKQALFFFLAGVGVTTLVAFKADAVKQVIDDIKYKVMVVPKTTTVMSGGKFEADVVVAAIDSETESEVFLDGRSEGLKAADGIVKYEEAVSGAGDRKFSGHVNVKTAKGIQKLPFSSTYSVYIGAANISAEAMNILYIGLDNLIYVSVPGFSAEKLTISCSGGVLTPERSGRGGYICRVTQRGEVMINVSVRMDDGTSRAMGSMKFRARNIAAPSAKLGTLSNGKVKLAAIKPNAEKLNGILPDGFPFEAIRYSVVQYTITVISKDGKVTSAERKSSKVVLNDATDASLSEDDKKEKDKINAMINGLAAGDKLLFTGVYAMGPDGLRSVNPLVIEVE